MPTSQPSEDASFGSSSCCTLRSFGRIGVAAHAGFAEPGFFDAVDVANGVDTHKGKVRRDEASRSQGRYGGASLSFVFNNSEYGGFRHGMRGYNYLGRCLQIIILQPRTRKKSRCRRVTWLCFPSRRSPEKPQKSRLPASLQSDRSIKIGRKFIRCHGVFTPIGVFVIPVTVR
jgi:hypothetical protein